MVKGDRDIGGYDDSRKVELAGSFPRETLEYVTPREIEIVRGLNPVVGDIQETRDLQLRDQPPFYSGVTEYEIGALAMRRPDVTSHYTYVHRNEAGDIITTPHHIVFASQFGSAADRIDRIVGQMRIGERETSRYHRRLTAQAHAFRTGGWEEVERARAEDTTEGNIIFRMGPYEPQLDSLGYKYSIQAVVGVVKKKETDRTNYITRAALTLSDESERGRSIPPIPIYVMHVLRGTGITLPGSDQMYAAQTLPNDTNWVDEYGARCDIYDNSLYGRLNRRLMPIIGRTFEPALKGFKMPQLMDAARNWIALHEINHPRKHEYEQDGRMGSDFWVFHEEHCDIAGLVMARGLARYNVLSRDELLAIATVHLASKILDIERYEYGSKEFPDPYADAAKTELNFLVRSAGLGRSPRSDRKITSTQLWQMLQQLANLNGSFNIYARLNTKDEVRNDFTDRYRGDDYQFLLDMQRSTDPNDDLLSTHSA